MGASARSDFLDQFEPYVLPYVLAFAHHLSSVQADVMVLTARKAACLFDAMRTVGLVAPPCMVVSDRVLDMDLQWLRGKRIVLVDEVLITGSTLYKHREKLLTEAGAHSVELLTLAVNEDRWSPDLASPDLPFLRLGNGPALNLCNQIVDALSVVPRPYNIDWPLLDGLRVDDASLASIQSLPGWRLQDARSSLQVKENIINLTHTAGRVIRRRLARELEVPSEYLRIAKVRLYGRRNGGRTGSYDLRIMPMGIVSELPVEESDHLFRAAVDSIAPINVDAFSTATSRARFTQFAFASYIARMWLKDFGQSSGVRFDADLEDSQIAFAFSPETFETVHQVSRANPPFSSAAPLILTAPRPRAANTGVSPANGGLWDLQRRLTEPFLELYETREVPASEVFLERGREAFQDDELTDLIDRLNRGHSFEDLEDLAAPLLRDQELDADRIVSAYLDVAIDHGVVVPVMQELDGIMRRAFRHGEDILFARNEAQLFAHMIAAAFRTSEKDSLPRLHVEKLLVIYLRIAMASRHVNRWTGRLGRAGTIGVRWNLKGAVLQVDAESVFGAEPGRGVSDFFVRMGVLKRNRKANGYSLGDTPPRASTRIPQESLAKKVGMLLGQLLQPSAGGAHLSTGDLTLLASVESLPSCVGALAAEVAIVYSGWTALGYRITSARTARADEIERALAQSDIYEAANSGCWKFLAYMSDRPAQIIDRVANELENELYKEEWLSYWPERGTDVREAAPRLFEQCEREGRWLLALDAYMKATRALLLRAADKEARSLKMLQDAKERARKHREFSRVSGHHHPLDYILALEARLADPMIDLRDAIAETTSRIDELMIHADSLLDAARAGVSLYGEARDVTSYSHALRISADAGEDAEAIADAVSAAMLKTQALAKQRGTALAEVRPSRRDGWPIIVSRGERGPRLLLDLAAQLLEANKGLRFRAELYVDLADYEQAHSGSLGGGFYCEALVAAIERADDELILSSSAMRSITVIGRPSVEHSGQPRLNSLLMDASRILNGRIVRRVAAKGREMHEVRIEVVDGEKAVADVGIVTIIDDEMRAVRSWLESCVDFSEEPSTDGRWFYRATVVIGDQSYVVVATQATQQGNSSMVNALQKLSEKVHPRLTVVLGIAGSVHEDARNGDVVLATQILDYGPVALTADGPRHRGEASKVPAAVQGAFNHYFAVNPTEHEFPMSDAAPAGSHEGFRIMRGPVGSGYAVVKNRDAEVRAWLNRFNEKTLVLETEASGAASFFYEHAIDASPNYIVLRGVSDHADEEKDDKWKLAASKNCVSALRQLLLTAGRGIIPSQQ